VSTPGTSVILPTHNPERERMRRVLAGLAAQTLPGALWETIVVNNASSSFPEEQFLRVNAPSSFRIVNEPELGLASARRKGIAEARGAAMVFVDDDNVLAPDYLERAQALFEEHPDVGTMGGKSIPEFAAAPEAWTSEFMNLLALRDEGNEARISNGLRPSVLDRNEYPACAPIGAGMVLRREAAQAWLAALEEDPTRGVFDRRGGELASGGDNDIVLSVMAAGWEVAYFPDLALTHLIPESRLNAEYLARLNHAMQKSWMRVLTMHRANPWPPLNVPAVVLRKIKAWFVYRPWASKAARVRFAGVCGHFDGRVCSRV
jgi:glycosyltransferase involved in cell wall biosynthesis